jgi:hypothetical protein
MLVPFTEKPYEKYVYGELRQQTSICFSPDQPLEGILGFDDGFFVPWWILATVAPYVRPSRRPHWSGIILSDLEQVSEKIGQELPPFRMNLFIQYKRPEHMKRASAAEWSSWNCRYFRYYTTPHQQDLLEKLDAHAAGRAVSVYASAAFSTSSDLFKFGEDKTVLVHSNVANVAQLKGHQRFTYASPGTIGVACSEPTRIEGEGLAVLSRLDGFEALPFQKHIIDAAKTVEAVVQDSNRFNRHLFQVARNALSQGAAPAVGRFSRAVQSIVAFSDAFNVSYYAVG